jgi:hypothetical protein
MSLFVTQMTVKAPVLGVSRLFQHHLFPLWKLCALAIQEAPLILLGLIFSFPVPNRKDRVRALLALLRCYAQNVYRPTDLDFRPQPFFQHGRVGTTPRSPSGPDLRLRPAIIRTAPCTPSTT